MKNLAVGLLRVRHRDDVRPLRHELIGSRDVAIDDFRPGCGALPRRVGVEHFVLGIRQHNGNGFTGLGVLDEAARPFAGCVIKVRNSNFTGLVSESSKQSDSVVTAL